MFKVGRGMERRREGDPVLGSILSMKYEADFSWETMVPKAKILHGGDQEAGVQENPGAWRLGGNPEGVTVLTRGGFPEALPGEAGC